MSGLSVFESPDQGRDGSSRGLGVGAQLSRREGRQVVVSRAARRGLVSGQGGRRAGHGPGPQTLVGITEKRRTGADVGSGLGPDAD